MSENRFPCGSLGQASRDMVCIETNRVLDSCRDRDCFEDIRVFLTDFGNEIIEHTASIRVKDSEIACAYIGIDPVRFNRGFYSVDIKFYVKLTFEACVCGHSQEFDGVAVLEKNVVLFGGDSNINSFRSEPCSDFCALPEPCNCHKNVPTAVVDAVSPIILGVRVAEKQSECHCCCCCCSDLPESVSARVNGVLNDEGNGKYLAVSIGLFSVVRIVRQGQFLVSATEYSVPDRECISPEADDPCSAFNAMPFPASEFCSEARPLSVRPATPGGCGCGK